VQRFDTMTRTIYAPDQPASFFARWSSRLALFFAFALPAALFLHRLFGLPTPVALNIAFACFAGAALAFVMAIIAGLDIWVTGRQGAARVVVASIVSLALLAVPAGLFVVGRNYPVINDVSTDIATPPQFVMAQKERQAGSNPTDYPSGFAVQQAGNYPDIKTLVVPRGAEETFELVLQALGKLKMRAAYESPPDEDTGVPGKIELTDKTMVLGFVDDVSIRVAGDTDTARIDVRSASRYGRSDFGRNAERVRLILREISGRVDASVPSPEAAEEARKKKDEKTQAKRSRDDSRESRSHRRRRRSPSR
jgi:uncharacterized protein (DUF1499 family)